MDQREIREILGPAETPVRRILTRPRWPVRIRRRPAPSRWVKQTGTFKFDYETFSQKDQILVKYQGAIHPSTRVVSEQMERLVKILTYSGTATTVTVEVIPNCAGGSGTAWNFTVFLSNSTQVNLRAPVPQKGTGALFFFSALFLF